MVMSLNSDTGMSSTQCGSSGRLAERHIEQIKLTKSRQPLVDEDSREVEIPAVEVQTGQEH